METVKPLGADNVADFMRIASDLITEAAEYAGSGTTNPTADANIRQLRTMTAALQAALMNCPVGAYMPTSAQPATAAVKP